MEHIADDYNKKKNKIMLSHKQSGQAAKKDSNRTKLKIP